MKLYQLFIKVNPKYSEQILKFVSDYCWEIQKDVGFTQIIEMNKIVNITLEQERKIGRQIYNKLSLSNLGKVAKSGKDICKGCYLCDRKTFKEKRNNYL